MFLKMSVKIQYFIFNNKYRSRGDYSFIHNIYLNTSLSAHNSVYHSKNINADTVVLLLDVIGVFNN